MCVDYLVDLCCDMCCEYILMYVSFLLRFMLGVTGRLCFDARGYSEFVMVWLVCNCIMIWVVVYVAVMR